MQVVEKVVGIFIAYFVRSREGRIICYGCVRSKGIRNEAKQGMASFLLGLFHAMEKNFFGVMTLDLFIFKNRVALEWLVVSPNCLSDHSALLP
ncbi:hypothetical protein [Fibrobacter intestinalis]|uniref:hypothetical protein n=1 Tax=Fibrobacter intestinalis TaxID=28122 RepID=UPI0023F2A69B|nr:hypothetical protein [Fibrobacter intestinalis]